MVTWSFLPFAINVILNLSINLTDIQVRLDESASDLLLDAHSSLRHKLSQIFEEETCYLDDRAICTKETNY